MKGYLIKARFVSKKVIFDYFEKEILVSDVSVLSNVCKTEQDAKDKIVAFSKEIATCCKN